MRLSQLVGVALFGCWLVAGCSFDDRHLPCSGDRDCNKGVGQQCYQGFCVPAPETTSSSEANTKGGRGGSAGDRSGGSGSGGASAGKGIDGGMSSSMDAAVSTPVKDAGRPDATSSCEEGAVQACDVPWESVDKLGGCGAGSRRCVNGAWDTCAPTNMVSVESCNNIDDDCDGKTDEAADNKCYLGDTKGCQANADGTFTCKGICKAGVQRCVDGELGVCEGSVGPKSKEDCSQVGVDEDCSGEAEDGCDCTGDISRPCYSGAMGTSGVGICREGTQRCVGGKWGACEGEMTMQAEVCNNRDDNCNGREDDVMGLGSRCAVPMQQGVCSLGTLRCQTGNTELQCIANNQKAEETCNGQDDDCDGTIDNVPAARLQTDPMHCGSCNRACGSGDSDKCCAGNCVNTNTDVMNCGACGRPCSAGQTCMNGMCTTSQPPDAGMMCATTADCATGEICCDGKCIPSDKTNCGVCGRVCMGTLPECCSNVCVDLSLPTNCGSCGNLCPTLDGGMSCTCATTGTAGTYQCRLNGNACP